MTSNTRSRKRKASASSPAPPRTRRPLTRSQIAFNTSRTPPVDVKATVPAEAARSGVAKHPDSQSRPSDQTHQARSITARKSLKPDQMAIDDEEDTIVVTAPAQSGFAKHSEASSHATNHAHQMAIGDKENTIVVAMPARSGVARQPVSPSRPANETHQLPFTTASNASKPNQPSMDLTEDEISSSDDEVQFIADYTGPGFDDSTGCLICYEDEENAGCDKVTCPRCEKVCHSKCVGEWNMCQVRALAAPWAGVLAQTAEEAGPCPCCRKVMAYKV